MFENISRAKEDNILSETCARICNGTSTIKKMRASPGTQPIGLPEVKRWLYGELCQDVVAAFHEKLPWSECRTASKSEQAYSYATSVRNAPPIKPRFWLRVICRVLRNKLIWRDGRGASRPYNCQTSSKNTFHSYGIAVLHHREDETWSKFTSG
jgi:hypothetical protein